MHRATLLVFFSLFLSACNTENLGLTAEDGPPQAKIDVSEMTNAVPKAEPRSKYGNPPVYQVLGKTYRVLDSSKGYHDKGIASWYGTKFHNKRTSSGEPYDMFAMTAAHKSLPLPTYLRVRNLTNNREVIVKVNDRGPFHENRIIDLSYAAAKKLGITAHGTGLVELSTISSAAHEAAQTPHPLDNSNKLYLQLGAFSAQSNAQALARKIKNIIQQPVRFQNSKLDDKPIYRVQVGPFTEVKATDLAYQQLKNAGLGEAITVIE